MPVVRSQTVELDQRFVSFIDADSSFDEFVKFSSLGNKLIVVCPIKHHRHYNDLVSRGFKRSKSTRLTVVNGSLYLDVILEREAIPIKSGKTIGIDMGIKKLMVDSDGNEYGKDIERLLDKANRKQFKSRAFDRALAERDAYINAAVKQLPLANVVIEDLAGLDKNTKKRLRKPFRKKVHRWTYANLIKSVERYTEVVGVQCLHVNPAYTSQTCSKCGFIHKSNRDAELFECGNCGYTADADFNASLNILNRSLAQQNMVAGSTKANIQL
jgi:putative transposase